MKLILFENIKTHNLLSKTNFDPYDSEIFQESRNMCKWSVKQFTSNHPLITVRIKVYEVKMVYRDVE